MWGGGGQGQVCIVPKGMCFFRDFCPLFFYLRFFWCYFAVFMFFLHFFCYFLFFHGIFVQKLLFHACHGSTSPNSCNLSSLLA